MDGRLSYHEFHHYSVIHDCDAVRLSVFDPQGSEFYMILPIDTAAGYRRTRQDALEIISEAIAMHLDPGEVILQ